MSPFVRFILLLLGVGIFLNFAIVLVSNANNHRNQVTQLANERDSFARMISFVGQGRLRRAEMTVEWQKTGADQIPIETSLLLRQFVPTDEDQQAPLPVVRVVIPGGRVCIEGVMLQFDSIFAEDYKELRSRQIFLFSHVYPAPDSAAPPRPHSSTDVDDRFTFFPAGKVPPALAIHNLDRLPRVTYFESKLWQYVWDQMQLPDPTRSGLTVKWTRAPSESGYDARFPTACKTVRTGVLYELSVGLEGVTIVETDGRMQRKEMLSEIENPRGIPPRRGQDIGLRP